MIKIVYVGNKPVEVVQKIKDKKFYIVDYNENSKYFPDNYILYIQEEDEEFLKQQKIGTQLYLEKPKMISPAKYRDLIFIDKLQEVDIPFRKIALQGSPEQILRWMSFFAKQYRASIKITGKNWIKKYLQSTRVFAEIEAYRGQCSFFKESYLEFILDHEPADLQLLFWNGEVREIYQLAEENKMERSKVFVLYKKGRHLKKAKKIFAVHYVRDHNVKKAYHQILQWTAIHQSKEGE